MARIATITKKEDLAPEHQKVYDAIAQAAASSAGRGWRLLHSPELAAAHGCIWAVTCASNRA